MQMRCAFPAVSIRILAFVMLLVVPALSRTANAQVPNVQQVNASIATKPTESSPLDRATTTAEVEAELESLASMEDLPEDEKKDATGRLKQAIQWLKAEQEAIRRSAEFEAQIESAPESIARLKNELAAPKPKIQAVVPENASLAQLEARLNELRQESKSRQNERDSIKDLVEGRGKRAGKISKEISDLEKRLEEHASPAASTTLAGYIGRAQQIEERSHVQALAAKLRMFQAESKRIEALAEQWPLELDVATRRLNHAETLQAKWMELVEQWRRDESQRHAEATRRMAEKAHPALGQLATRNADIAQLRLETVQQIERVSAKVAELKAIEESLQQKFESMRSRVEHAPDATSTGILLRKQRDELPKQSACRDRAAELQAKTPQAHLLLNELEQEREEVADPVSQSELIVQSLSGELSQFSDEQVSGAVAGLLRTRRELLDKLIADQNTHLRNLSELEVINQDLMQQIVEFRSFLDEHVLWVCSTEMLGLRDFSSAWVAAGRLMEPVRWNEALRAAAGETLRRPAVFAAAIALLVLAFGFRKSVERRLVQLCVAPKYGTPMQFGRALSGIGLSMVLSAGWPAVLLALGYRLTVANNTSEFGVGLGKAFLAVAALAWGCQLVREICLEGRVGHRMFLWPPSVLVSVRRTLEMTVLFGAPMIGVLVLSDHVNVDGAASLHRLALVSMLGFVSLQCFTLLRSDGAVMKSVRDQLPGSMVCRFGQLIWLASIGAPIILAGISAVGFHYSATQLSGRFAESLVAILGLIVMHSLALRWLRIKGYNRKLRESIAAYAARKAESSQSSEASDGDASHDEKEGEIEWGETADGHVRDLLRYATLTVLLIGGWFVWADVLPALRVLDRVVLWNNIAEASEMIAGADGVSALRTFQINLPTTLKDGIVAILVVVTTILIARRLPSVLELTLLERLPIDRGGRDAIAILVRYATTIIGVLVACKLIHLRWSSVQWLAAAMTVGLGFGLQEIFANLVSGLIILFERPIRQGDVVTVGDVTGHVTAMRIRATTITDYDRRELIVPNKRFITDNVVNWTLSDPISRAVVNVGVAYGTDTERVEQILLSVARKSSVVLSSPDPAVVFSGFGDSTLDFELRVFIARRDTYPEVVHDLNTAINRELNAADIEIAFPQRDLNIRSIPAEWTRQSAPAVSSHREAA